MAPLPTPPCVALRVHYGTDQWLPDVTAGLIINYYTSVDQNEYICSSPGVPRCRPVAAERRRRLSAPSNPFQPLRCREPGDTSRGPEPRRWDMPRDNICHPLGDLPS